MARDVLSMISKRASKPATTAKVLLPKLQSSLKANSITIPTTGTHKITIVDEYLIKVQPHIPHTSTFSSATAFDLDHTLITTKSGTKKFSRGPHDWTWFNDKVVPSLKSITTPIVIFTNQGAVIATKTSKSFANFTKKCELILAAMEKEGIDVSKVWILASPKKGSKYSGQEEEMFNKMRKPEIGMWDHLRQAEILADIVKDDCLYVGDAAGRASDFSDSDKKFAINCGIPFKTPEEYFI